MVLFFLFESGPWIRLNNVAADTAPTALLWCSLEEGEASAHRFSGSSGAAGRRCRDGIRISVAIVTVGIGIIIGIGSCSLSSFLHLLHALMHRPDRGPLGCGRAQRLRRAGLLVVLGVHPGDFGLSDEALVLQTDFPAALVAVPEDEEDDWKGNVLVTDTTTTTTTGVEITTY